MSEAQARKFDPIAVSPLSTVVAEYVPDAAGETSYQSEAALERDLIAQLESPCVKHSIRLTATSEIRLGRHRDYLSMCNCS